MWAAMEKTVAIVGRPNVGKSALFNRLTRKQISLVFDRPGTTRDRIIATCSYQEQTFTLIDTGGIGFEDRDDFGTAIAREADLALEAASHILFVVDAREGLTPLDRDVARLLRRAAGRVIVVANKMDAPAQAHLESEFAELGFGNPVGVSAAHGLGVERLLDTLTEGWPPDPEPDESTLGEDGKPKQFRPTRVTIVGRPNVGKSSLINALLSDKRTIVSPVSGTTRDAVDIPYVRNGREYTLIDTAGMRQERRIQDPLEGAMTGRSAHAINRADVCVLVIDASEGVSSQDKKIGGLIQEAMKPCVIVVNKWDIAREQGDGGTAAQRAYYEQVMGDLFFLHYASVAFLSAKTGERVHGLFTLIERLDQSRQFRFATGPLNRVISKAMEKHPPPISGPGGRRLKILYATQEPLPEGKPPGIPVILLFVNSAKMWSASYQRYLDLQLRDAFDIPGVPIRFVLRERQQQKDNPNAKRSAAGAAGKRGAALASGEAAPSSKDGKAGASKAKPKASAAAASRKGAASAGARREARKRNAGGGKTRSGSQRPKPKSRHD
ncbi:ribosome biogenesis GTPase Der [Verrucomicrobia bacterium LW23]|nr:ribosome biogenesis GTPase Der [Verrucomicrobia bacterium LW23]